MRKSKSATYAKVSVGGGGNRVRLYFWRCCSRTTLLNEEGTLPSCQPFAIRSTTSRYYHRGCRAGFGTFRAGPEADSTFFPCPTETRRAVRFRDCRRHGLRG